MDAETRTVTYRKACEFKGATASGPRMVRRGDLPMYDGTTLAKFGFARLACDTCDTPWTEDAPHAD